MPFGSTVKICDVKICDSNFLRTWCWDRFKPDCQWFLHLASSSTKIRYQNVLLPRLIAALQCVTCEP
jgi:hypothetical protein